MYAAYADDFICNEVKWTHVFWQGWRTSTEYAIRWREWQSLTNVASTPALRPWRTSWDISQSLSWFELSCCYCLVCFKPTSQRWDRKTKHTKNAPKRIYFKGYFLGETGWEGIEHECWGLAAEFGITVIVELVLSSHPKQETRNARTIVTAFCSIAKL